MPADRASRGGRALGLGRGGWTVFAVAWATFAAGYLAVFMLDTERGAVQAAATATRILGPAIVLSLGVLVLCRRLDLPEADAPRLRFAALHIVAALAFPILWVCFVAGSRMVEGYLATGQWRPIWPPGNVFHWHMLAGTLIYAATATLHYGFAIARRQARALSTLEMRLLRAQLDPHFLFNTLHMIHGMVERRDPAAPGAVEGLGTMLRHVLRYARSGEEGVPLRRELDFARAYLELQNRRRRIPVGLEVEMVAGAEDWGVPAFALQIPLENALRHGFPVEAGGQKIAIEASRQGQWCRLRVADTGIGASAPERAVSGGGGLGNLADRLAFLHGRSAKIEAGHAAGGGFVLDLTFPEVTEEDRDAGDEAIG